MVGEHGDVIHTSRLHLQHEIIHGGISTEGECSTLVEDTATSTKHDQQRCVMGVFRGTVPGEVIL